MTRTIKQHKIILSIVFLGFLLRLFQLGNDILWYDEVGVFGVTKAKNLEEIIFIVRSHVMAMPMDYFITWLFSRLGSGNAILRFPSVIWGSLTLPVCYLLFKDLLDTRSALWGTFLAALSPFLIQYSQELRFYASFTFFYLFSTLLLLRAMKSDDPRQWIVFTITAIMGIYFHMYVLLVLANGILWFLFSDEKPLDRKRSFRYLLISYISILIAFAAGFLLFSGRVTFSNPFLESGITFIQTVFTGLGWLPFYSISPEWSWGWGFLCLVLEIYGILVLMKKPFSASSTLLYSIFLQIVLIITFDYLKKYFFMPRQLLPYLPILLLPAGLALSTIQQNFEHYLAGLKKTYGLPRREIISSMGMVCIILLFNIPALVTYYEGSKGNADVITSRIHDSWQPGSTVLVVNPYEGGYYNYFFSEILKNNEIISSVWQTDWNMIAESKTWKGKVYVITPLFLTSEQQNILASAGYQLATRDTPFSRYNRLLYIKGN